MQDDRSSMFYIMYNKSGQSKQHVYLIKEKDYNIFSNSCGTVNLEKKTDKMVLSLWVLNAKNNTTKARSTVLHRTTRKLGLKLIKWLN